MAKGAGGAKPATAVHAEPLEALRVMVAEGILVGVNTFDPDGCRDEEA